MDAVAKNDPKAPEEFLGRILSENVLFRTIEDLLAAPRSLAESAGIPAPMVEWATTNHSPSTTELIDAFGAAAVAARTPAR